MNDPNFWVLDEEPTKKWLPVEDSILERDKDILVELAEKLDRKYERKRFVKLVLDRIEIRVAREEGYGDKIIIYVDGECVCDDFI